jgi:hypothetical protein
MRLTVILAICFTAFIVSDAIQAQDESISDQVRNECIASVGSEHPALSKCMAQKYEELGYFGYACIRYQGIDEPKAKEMAIAQARLDFQNGNYEPAAYTFETFDMRKEADEAWTKLGYNGRARFHKE